ncbi:MAG: hypothetical protein AAGB93_01430 [Planctomycetota bacterium]
MKRSIAQSSVLPGLALLAVLLSCSSTETPLPDPVLVESPAPRSDAGGRFVSPYLDSGELTAWAAGAIEAGAHVDAATALGLQRDDIVGSGLALVGRAFTGDAEEASETTLAAVGGWETIRSTSNVSFDSADGLAAYLYGEHLRSGSFPAALKLTFDLYPEVEATFFSSVRSAAADAPAVAADSVAAEAQERSAIFESDIRAMLDGLSDRYDAEVDAVNAKLERELDRIDEDTGGLLGPAEGPED